VKVETSERARHLVLRAELGDVLPDALLRLVRELGVVAGWFRGSGVLEEIELRVYGAKIRGHGALRREAGPLQALVLDGTLGIAGGDMALGLRAVFARETDQGVETLAGELTAARVVALEGVVTVLDDVVMPRGLDPVAGIWLMTDPSRAVEGAVAPRQVLPSDKTANISPAQQGRARAAPPAWSDAIAASAATPKDKTAAAARSGQPIPIRPARPVVAEDDNLFPQAGDMVEHFAFGTCEVFKSDGDRLHLRVGKDGRMREIALEMLRVTLLASDGETHRYRLDRKM
jgi:predicted DNA-binding protein with PD1-like motif